MARGKSFLFLGPETGEKQDEIDKLRAQVKAQHPSFEEPHFFIVEDNVSKVVSTLLNGSLFSDFRFVIIRNAELIKGDARKKTDDVRLLSSYLTHQDENTCIVFESEATTVDKNFEKAVSEKKRVFYEMFEGRKKEWVSGYFYRKGYKIQEPAVDAILDMVVNTTDALRSECDRLMLFLKRETPVTETDIENILSKTREESAFTLFSAIARFPAREGEDIKNYEKSLDILNTLMSAQQEVRAILGGLLSCFIKLRDYISLGESGDQSDGALRGIGIFTPTSRADYSAACRVFNKRKTEAAISLCIEYQHKTVIYQEAPVKVILELFLSSLLEITRQLI